MSTYVLVHGAWHTGKELEPTAAPIRAAGAPAGRDGSQAVAVFFLAYCCFRGNHSCTRHARARRAADSSEL